MPIGYLMRKLSFVASRDIIDQEKNCNDVEQYITQLLTEKLTQQGFETLAQSGAQVAVAVDQRELPLSISCASPQEDGHMVCEISSYPDENQDWLARISERSLLNQLAQAVENTLKDDQRLTGFHWSEK